MDGQRDGSSEGKSGAKFRENVTFVNGINLPHDSACGLALLNNEVYVVHENQPSIYVYNEKDLKLTRRLACREPPRDIICCETNICLYTICREKVKQNGTIFRIMPNGKELNKWYVPNKPRNLSITPQGIIVVMCADGICHYDSNGKLVNFVNMKEAISKTIQEPCQAIFTQDDIYLVCHGWHKSLHGVVKVNKDGQIIGSFKGVRDSYSVPNLINPVHMALRKDGFVYVADRASSSVVLLSRELQFVSSFPTDEEGYSEVNGEPCSVLLNETSGLLYVGTRRANLSVYRI